MSLVTIIIGAHTIIWVTCLIILGLLILRRIRIKKTEHFEDRDN
jgi:hypothetical protein